MIHIAADLTFFELAVLGILGMGMFALWILILCKVIELFNQD